MRTVATLLRSRAPELLVCNALNVGDMLVSTFEFLEQLFLGVHLPCALRWYDCSRCCAGLQLRGRLQVTASAAIAGIARLEL